MCVGEKAEEETETEYVPQEKQEDTMEDTAAVEDEQNEEDEEEVEVEVNEEMEDSHSTQGQYSFEETLHKIQMTSLVTYMERMRTRLR